MSSQKEPKTTLTNKVFFRIMPIFLIILSILTACAAKSENEVETISENCMNAKESGIEICQEDEICGVDAACHSCGKIGELCCEGGNCEPGTICSDDGTCKECGNNNELCCSNKECNSSNICSPDGYCQSCGSVDEQCCEGNTCQELYICDANGYCKSCGSDGLPVCEDGLCKDWHFVENDICISCGGEYQPICPSIGCGGWYFPFYCSDCPSWLMELSGLCVNPFKEINLIDDTYCENFESNTDMCYWNAAYFGKDSTFCENITLKEAKDKCFSGANPENYAIYNIPFAVPD